MASDKRDKRESRRDEAERELIEMYWQEATWGKCPEKMGADEVEHSFALMRAGAAMVDSVTHRAAVKWHALCVFGVLFCSQLLPFLWFVGYPIERQVDLFVAGLVALSIVADICVLSFWNTTSEFLALEPVLAGVPRECHVEDRMTRLRMAKARLDEAEGVGQPQPAVGDVR